MRRCLITHRVADWSSLVRVLMRLPLRVLSRRIRFRESSMTQSLNAKTLVLQLYIFHFGERRNVVTTRRKFRVSSSIKLTRENRLFKIKDKTKCATNVACPCFKKLDFRSCKCGASEQARLVRAYKWIVWSGSHLWLSRQTRDKLRTFNFLCPLVLGSYSKSDTCLCYFQSSCVHLWWSVLPYRCS